MPWTKLQNKAEKFPSRVGIVGSTGAVGEEFLKLLESRSFPFSELRLLASSRSQGRLQNIQGINHTVRELNEKNLENLDLVFFSAGREVALRYGPRAAELGAWVIDNSSAFRRDPQIPLIVPEINIAALKNSTSKIIANPNCSTIIAALPLFALHKEFGLKKVLASTYQAVSGAGAQAMTELKESTLAFLSGEAFLPKVFPIDSAFNLFSHNSAMDRESGYNEEEKKFSFELQKIFSMPNLWASATCVRVPVLRAHSISLYMEFEKPVDLDLAQRKLAGFPGLVLRDDREGNRFPTPREVSGKDEIYVGRLRYDLQDSQRKSLWLFVVGDQLLKGAALNGIQIAETLVSRPS